MKPHSHYHHHVKQVRCPACLAWTRPGKIHRRSDYWQDWCDGQHDPVRVEAEWLVRWLRDRLNTLCHDRDYEGVVAFVRPILELHEPGATDPRVVS